MKKLNSKGFGLVMAIMIVTVLLIMAAGFFTVTDFSTRSVYSDNRRLELYWAAESASNYNVNWWITQPEEVRVNWPSTYIAPSSKGTVYNDTDLKAVYDSKFPHGEGIAKKKLLYLHGSSLAEGNTEVIIPALENVGGKKLITTRYKGERADAEDYAVWVLDSYAWDPDTGEMSNIVMTNVYNIRVFGWNALLENSEAIYNTMAGAGFAGALGAFHQKDVRYGPCYFNGLIRLDYQTGGTTGARFFKGPVQSAAMAAGDPLAQSRWGNDIETTTNLISKDEVYGYGIALRSSDPKNEAEAIKMISDVLNIGTTPYVKDAAVINTENLLWSWGDIVEFGPTNGFYFLKDYGFPPGNVDIKLEYDNKTNMTIAIVSSGTLTQKIPVGRGTGKYASIVATKEYGTVSIQGVSGDDFTLFTENNQVDLTGHLYVQEMQTTLDKLRANIGSISQNTTDEALLRLAWENMKHDTKGKLGIVAMHNPDVTPQSVTPWYISVPRGDLLFSTAAFVGIDGHMGILPALSNSTSMKFVNVGSIITLGAQNAKLGDPSGKWTKALVQDVRYTNQETDVPPGFGPGPSDVSQLETVFGLNPKHRWTSEFYSTTRDWKEIVWRHLY